MYLAKLVAQGRIHRSDAVAELSSEWAMTGTAAEDVLDRMTDRNAELTEQQEWDIANNILDTEEIGAEKFHIQHFKGLRGWRDHTGLWHQTDDEVHEYWSVSLPHQCDDWEIVDCSDHADAVRKLQLFITDAQKALEKLRSMGP